MSSKDEQQSDVILRDLLDKISSLENRLQHLESQNGEIRALLRILAEPILASSLKEVFKSAKQLYAYELSNGERSTRDIGNLVKLDQKGISNWWREWEREGLVEKVGKKGQFKARYNLLELLVVYLPTRKQKFSKDKSI